jgi:CHAT domain-containing protein
MRSPLVIWIALLIVAVPVNAQPADIEHAVGKDGLALTGQIAEDDAKVTVYLPANETLALPSKRYLVKLLGGKSYRVTMRSKDIDSYLVVKNPQGKQIAFDDDSGGGLDADLTIDVHKDGLYRIHAAAFKRTGPFALTVREEVVHVVGADGLSLKGRFGANADSVALSIRDQTVPATRHLVKLVRGHPYRVILESKEVDSFVFVKDDEGKLIAFADGSKGSVDAVTFRSSESAICRIYVGSSKGIGPYSLEIQDPNAEPSDSPFNPDELSELREAEALQRKAIKLHDLGKSDEAVPLVKKIVETRRKILGERHPETARALNVLGVLFEAQGDLESAKPPLEEALSIYKDFSPEQHADAAIALHSLGILYLLQKDYAAARPYFEQAMVIQRRSLDRAVLALSEQQQFAMTQSFRIYLDNYLSVGTDDRNQPSLAAVDYDHVLAWKGAISARQRQLRFLRRNPALAPIAEKLQELTLRLANLASAPPRVEKAEGYREELRKLIQKMEETEVELARRAADLHAEGIPKCPGSAAFAKSLAEGCAVVDFLEYSHIRPDPKRKGMLLGEQRLAAFVIRPDVPVVRVEMGPVAKIVDAVENWRSRVLVKRSSKADDEPGQLLRRLLWTPIEQYLGRAKTILVSPDGAVCRVPFAALPGASPGKYLLEEEFTVSVLPLPRLLPSLNGVAAAASAESLLLVGDVNYGAAPGQPTNSAAASDRAAVHGVFLPLDNTRSEILAVGDTFARRFKKQATILREEAATEAAFREAAPKHRWLHLASHGFFAAPDVKSADRAEGAASTDLFCRSNVAGFRPGLLSGIAMAGANRPSAPGQDDGILTATEVAELDLTHTELVVLSACETGLGLSAGGEGILGLQRSFQIAGAGGVVASLWKVDDAVTRQLMERFYENLWSKKMTKSEALRQAQLYVLREGSMRGFIQLDAAETLPASRPSRVPPYFWAAFVLSGDWR